MTKGEVFEDRVYRILERALQDNELPWQSALCRLHRRKSYYSPDRESGVNFENVIEVFVPETIEVENAQPSTVAIFECKDHGRNVEVGELDEVRGRVAPSYGFAIKAYVVTEKGFARGCITTAKNSGIGLIKIVPDDKIKHVMYHLTSETIENEKRTFPNRARRALEDPTFEAVNESFYGYDDGYVFSSLHGILRHFATAKPS